MQNSIQHVQVPSHQDLTPDEKMVYTYLKRYMNGQTYEAFPSLPTLAKELKMNKTKLQERLRSLEAKKFIQIISRPGKSSIYKFNKWVKFEPFSEEFLTDKKTDLDEKQFIICAQEHMFINPDTHDGKISYSDSALSKKTGLDRRFIKRVNDSLKEKGYMTPVPLKIRDKETGLAKEEKFYHLDEFNQAVAYVLQDHEDRITSTEKDISILYKEIERLQKELELQRHGVQDIILN